MKNLQGWKIAVALIGTLGGIAGVGLAGLLAFQVPGPTVYLDEFSWNWVAGLLLPNLGLLGFIGALLVFKNVAYSFWLQYFAGIDLFVYGLLNTENSLLVWFAPALLVSGTMTLVIWAEERHQRETGSRHLPG
jgi:hypothetical protein